MTTRKPSFFVLEHVLVVVHGVPVSERPHLILQHFLCDRKGKSVSMHSRVLGVHQGQGPQDCPTKLFKDVDDVTRKATEAHCGAARPEAIRIVTNNSSPKQIALYYQRGNSCPDLGKLQFTKNKIKSQAGST